MGVVDHHFRNCDDGFQNHGRESITDSLTTHNLSYYRDVETGEFKRAKSTKEVKTAWQSRLDTVEKTVRKDAVVANDWIFQAGDINEQPDYDHEVFIQSCLDFLSERYGNDNLVGYSLHLDEITEIDGKKRRSPHLHVLTTPVTADGRLSHKDFVTGKDTLRIWQREYKEHMSERMKPFFDVDMETKAHRRHETIDEYKARKKYEETIKAESSLLSERELEILNGERINKDKAERLADKAEKLTEREILLGKRELSLSSREKNISHNFEILKQKEQYISDTQKNVAEKILDIKEKEKHLHDRSREFERTHRAKTKEVESLKDKFISLITTVTAKTSAIDSLLSNLQQFTRLMSSRELDDFCKADKSLVDTQKEVKTAMELFEKIAPDNNLYDREYSL